MIDGNSDEPDRTIEWNYCRVCLESDQTEQKYKSNCPTTVLLRHLKNKHGLFKTENEAFAGKAKIKMEKDISFETDPIKIIDEGIYCNEASTSSSKVLKTQNKIRLSVQACHICSKSFTRNADLIRHLRIHDVKHHDKSNDSALLSRYQCDKCSKYYSRMNSL